MQQYKYLSSFSVIIIQQLQLQNNLILNGNPSELKSPESWAEALKWG